MVIKNKAKQALILNFNTSSLDILLIWSFSLLPLHASPLRPPQIGGFPQVSNNISVMQLEQEIYPQMGDICVSELPVWGQ